MQKILNSNIILPQLKTFFFKAEKTLWFLKWNGKKVLHLFAICRRFEITQGFFLQIINGILAHFPFAKLA